MSIGADLTSLAMFMGVCQPPVWSFAVRCRLLGQAHQDDLGRESARVLVGGVELDRVDPQESLVGLDPFQKFVDLGEASFQRQAEAERLIGAEILGLFGLEVEQFQRRRTNVVDDMLHQIVGVGLLGYPVLIRCHLLLELLELARGGELLALAGDPGRGGGHLLAQGAEEQKVPAGDDRHAEQEPEFQRVAEVS